MTVALPHINTLDPQDLYDLIMVQIEPDLMSTNVGKLATKYTGESSAAKAERIERYKQARALYKQELEAYLQRSSTELTKEHQAALLNIEQESRDQEAQQLTLLEEYFTS